MKKQPTRDIKKLKQEYEDMCRRIEPNATVSLLTNRKMTKPALHKLIDAYWERIDRKLGADRYKNWPWAHSDGMLFIERDNGNIHVQGRVRIPDWEGIDIETYASKLWSELCPGGSGSLRITNEWLRA